MAKHAWNGHEIEVECYSVPRTFWTGYSLSVHIDGSPAGRSPDHWEGFHTVVPFQINDNGNIRNGSIVSGHIFLALRGPYRVLVEDKQIASGVVRAANWYVPYGILPGLMLGILFLLYLIHIHR
jgi:hypothetical protein